MGEKTFQIMGALSCVVMAASAAVFCLPMHRLSFFTGGFIRAARIETHLLTVEFQEDGSGFCKAINYLRPGTCSDDSFSLEEVQQRFCAPVVATAYPQGCHGFQNAFRLGIGLAVSLVLNTVGLVCVLFALHSYIYGQSHKRSYRSLALIALVVSTLQLGAAVSMYGLFVFRHLDEMKARGASGMVTKFVFAASEGIGASFGFFACASIIFLQLFMLAIWQYTKTSQEQSDEEIREKKLFAAGLEAHAGYGGVPAAAPPAQPWPQAEQVLYVPGGAAPQQWDQPPTGFGGAAGAGPAQAWPQAGGPAPQQWDQPAGLLAPSTCESQPLEMRRGQTYMPDAPPSNAV
ncbi:unnamed protein product [Prorocentrum cordatum]|uniref:Protein S-acyltransferase n=1 Tax=Prorocentrum cordatum TaxID=2364126 RepID=A0ABN9VYA9_9DINO|nr:unnamed protein product [Polarella glacialis]